MGLLNIQKYLVFSLRDHTENFDEIGGFLRIDPEMLMILIILSSRASCCTSVLKIKGLPHAYNFSRHGKRKQSIFILVILQFPYSENLYLDCKTF
jgi:hypothetical protein